jgi:hypothetical protein
MIDDEHDHAACVEVWWSRVSGDASAAAALRVLERGFGAVWARASITLGDVTMMAIGDRVLSDAATTYPLVAALRLEATGISCEDLERDADAIERAELDAASCSILVELLTVLGRLTGDVLTPALHAQLCADTDADQESAP